MEYPFQQPDLITKLSNSNPKPYRYGFIRFFLLALLSFVGFANEYTFNNPQALQTTIEEKLSINESEFNLLYTIVAIPNIFFSFLSGIVIDYFGIRMTFVIMAILMPLFQLIVAFGGLYESYNLLLIGRFFFGVVDQSILIAIACYTSSWFMGKQISLALGLVTTLPQFGNALNSYLSPIIYEKTQSLGAPLFVSVGICLIAFVCALAVTYLDVRADEADKQLGIEVKAIEESEVENEETFRFQDLKALRWTYWLIAGLCMFALAGYVPFLDNVNKLLQVRFCFSQVTAGRNITVTYLVVGIFGFPLGWFMDKVGYKRYFAILCMAIFTLGHFIILVFPQCYETDIIREWAGVSWGLFLLGIGYCFYANCLVPSIPLVVKKKVIGTAFGLMEMLQNVAMAFYPIVAASIIQQAKSPETGYRLFSLFYLSNCLIGLLLSTFLLFISHKDKKKLDAASGEHKLQKVLVKQSLTDYENMQRSQKKHKKKKTIASDDCYDEKEDDDKQHIEKKNKFLLEIGEYRKKRATFSEKKREKFQINDDQSEKQTRLSKKKSIKNTKEIVCDSNDASEQDNIGQPLLNKKSSKK